MSAPKLLALDFDGVLTTNQVFVAMDGSEAVLCSRFDGVGLARLKLLGVPAVVISQETSAVVAARCHKLGIDFYQGIGDKRSVLDLLTAAAHISLADVAYLGNDIGDLACLRDVGHPYIVRDAHDSVRGYGFTVLHKAGGQGAVRELCDRIADAIEGKPLHLIQGLDNEGRWR